MEGLEVNEVSFEAAAAIPDMRIDAEFFAKMPPENVAFKWVPIGSVLESSQYGISIEMNEDGVGYPIYRMNEIEHMLCIEDISKCADVPSQEAHPFLLKDRDVLFNRTNSQVFVGRTGLFRSFDDGPRIFASYLVRLTPNHASVLPEYLVAFLNSERGVRDIKRRARISINQSNVNPEEVKAIRIPLLSLNLQKQLKKLFDKSHELICSGEQHQAHAEQNLLRSLDLEGWEPPEPLTYTRRASEVIERGRYDAEHYQQQYYALAAKLREYPAGVASLGELCPNPMNGVEIREYADEGVPYLRVGDIRDLTVKADGVKYVSEAAAADEIEKVRLKVGDVLVSRSGSLAVTGVVEPEWVHSVISSHLILVRISDPAFKPHYVAAFLAAMPGKMQIIQHSNGGVQPEINQPSLKRVLIPRLAMESQTAIIDGIRQAHEARQEAKALLAKAKRAVEVAIEEGEAAAFQFLNATP